VETAQYSLLRWVHGRDGACKINEQMERLQLFCFPWPGLLLRSAQGWWAAVRYQTLWPVRGLARQRETGKFVRAVVGVLA